jgi:hypothetical protein
MDDGLKSHGNSMSGVRLGGIDPSILRELSGVYKPFVKAFKELISNAFDADADKVEVELGDDCTWLSVADDGTGMTPFEFRNDFTRIGGGSRRWLGQRTRKGRLRIGSKGIGFLALARYCSELEVESSANRKFLATYLIPSANAPICLDDLVGFAIPAAFFDDIKVSIKQEKGKIGRLSEVTHFRVDATSRTVQFLRPVAGPLKLTLSVTCASIAFRATLDFGRLLELADKADLDKIEQFATMELFPQHQSNRPKGTYITAKRLMPFVRRELQGERRKGHVRNVASRSGIEQFTWHLARCTPIAYEPGPAAAAKKVSVLLKQSRSSILDELTVKQGGETRALLRPVYPFEAEAHPLHDDMLVEVAIKENGLKAFGFIAGYESVVFPAEYRGITIRVRGVAIGEPTFLGAEYLLTGANKAALSQITGEINVLKGLDAVDALNPGRESFYEECDQYKTLRRHLVGDGEAVSGCLGKAISAVLRRSQVRSSLKDVVGRATLRRRALDDISSAVCELIAGEDRCADGIHRLLGRKESITNGLAKAPEFLMSVPPRIGGLKVVHTIDLREPVEIDYGTSEIRLDTSRPEWDWTLMLFNRRFRVCNKRAGALEPLGEIDLQNDLILLNWEHPIRSQMDERGFLRTAVSWILAKEAGANDADRMMELALRLLSFRSGVVDG